MVNSIIESLEQVQALAAKGTKPEALGLDGFPVFAEDPLAPFQRQLNKYLEEMPKEDLYNEYMCSPTWTELSTCKALLKYEPEQMAQVLRAILVRLLYKQRAKRNKGPLSIASLAGLLKVHLGREKFSE